MSGRSSPLSDRLRSLRAEAIRSGRRVFQLVEVGGVPVKSPAVRGEYPDVASALDMARRFGLSSCVVREWACLDAYRVHVDSVEWLLSWSRVRSLSTSNEGARRFDRPGEAQAGRARAERPPEWLRLINAFCPHG